MRWLFWKLGCECRLPSLDDLGVSEEGVVNIARNFLMTTVMPTPEKIRSMARLGPPCPLQPIFDAYELELVGPLRGNASAVLESSDEEGAVGKYMKTL